MPEIEPRSFEEMREQYNQVPPEKRGAFLKGVRADEWGAITEVYRECLTANSDETANPIAGNFVNDEFVKIDKPKD